MRTFGLLAAVAALPAMISAYPLGVRDATDTDVLVFQFADVLEQLETQFYAAALQKFSADDVKGAGFSDPNLVVEQLKQIQGDEATHASVLEDAITSTFGKELASKACKFNFDSALTTLDVTLATARVVENVGVMAYVGAAHLLSDPVLLSAAASIATVEARHQTILNILSGNAALIPQAFDMALTPSEVLALAGPFISGCDLGVPANTPLAIKNTPVKPGDKLEFDSTALNSTVDSSKFSCQIMVGGDSNSRSFPIDDCKVPDDVSGPMAVWITSDDQPLANDVVNRDTTKQIAGPALTFVDSKVDLIPTLVRQTDASKTSSGSETTSTVTPDEAKKIAQGGEVTDSGSDSSSDDSKKDDSSNSDSSSDDSSKDSSSDSKDGSDASSDNKDGSDSSSDSNEGSDSSSDNKDGSDSSSDNSGDNKDASSDNSEDSSAESLQTNQNKATGPTKAGGLTVDGWGEIPADQDA
jgi:hypothetical protein